MELYAEAFDHTGHLDMLEGFASFYGADFYGLPRNTGTITLIEKSQTVPATLDFGNEQLIPLLAGTPLRWSLQKML
jgi:dihydroorotase